MKIKKIDEEETYVKRAKTETFELNGKKIRVYSWYEDGTSVQNYDWDYEVDEKDEEKLTENERDIFLDIMFEIVGSKVGTETIIKEE